MSNAPERIWANVAVWSGPIVLAGEWNHCDLNSHDDTEYLRSDIPRPQDAARIAELEAENARLFAARAAIVSSLGDVK
jgi:hypothetical protein